MLSELFLNLNGGRDNSSRSDAKSSFLTLPSDDRMLVVID